MGLHLQRRSMVIVVGAVAVMIRAFALHVLAGLRRGEVVMVVVELRHILLSSIFVEFAASIWNLLPGPMYFKIFTF